MQKGTEPWVVITTITGVATQLVGFFSLYHSAKGFPVACLLAFSLLSPLAGGIVWQYLNKVNGWRFHLGGPGNEPYGVYAAIWGAITILPVMFSVRIVTGHSEINSIFAVAQWFVSRDCALVFACAVLAALLAVVVYGGQSSAGLRSIITAKGWSYELTEQAMIVIWSCALSAAPIFALLIFGGPAAPLKSMPHLLLYAAPTIVSTALCLLALSAYFGLYDYLNLDQKAQIRGLIAGYGLRFGMFWGTWLAIDSSNFDNIWNILKLYATKPFS